MAEVKWIKIVTDIFDNRKIKQIEIMPDGDTILVIWFKLICLAGSINDNGLIYLTPEIPYTEEMLAAQFGRSLPIVRLALRTFESFGMIEVVDNFLCLPSWEKYQSAERLAHMRSKNAERQARFRERKRAELAEKTVTPALPVTPSNAPDIDIEEDIEEDIENREETPPPEPPAPPKPPKPEIYPFDEFWKVYPKKKAKEDARKAWTKLKPNEALGKAIIKAVEDAKKTADWKKEKGKFIPYPATYLNGKRWEDEEGSDTDGVVENNLAPNQWVGTVL